MTDVIMPQMGESIAEGTITKWMKKVGDKVQRDEPLFEISTDKVDAEIPAPAAGVLAEIRVEPGATVPINTVVGIIAAEGDAIAAPAPAAAPPPAPTPPAPPAPVGPAPAPVPATAPAPVRAATPPPPAPAPQFAPAPAPPRPAAAPPPPAAAALPAPSPAAAAGDDRSRASMSAAELRQTRSSPLVRRIAAEHNVDIRHVPGSGLSGRVTKQDILTHIEGREAPASAAPTPVTPTPVSAPAVPAPAVSASSSFAAAPVAAPPAAPVAPAPAPAPIAAEAAEPPAQPVVPARRPGERVQVVPMSPIRRKTAEHMTLSKRISAHVTSVFEIDMTRIDLLRHKHREAYQQRSGVKLTYMPFIIKAAVDALKAFPILNSSVEADSILYKKDINVGLAVALDWGLIVPVIHNADERNVLGLAKAVADLAERARAKRLRVEEVQGGTFTITNPGVFGSLFGTPIINQPQVAILGVGTIEKRTVVRDDAIAIRTMAYFAITFDHRVVDGADADRFMAHLKKGLQEFDETCL